jgi:hypothetical protein
MQLYIYLGVSSSVFEAFTLADRQDSAENAESGSDVSSWPCGDGERLLTESMNGFLRYRTRYPRLDHPLV